MDEQPYWLIERANGLWWCGCGAVWTRDAQDAVRFCRERDARACLDWLRRELASETGEWSLLVTEHIDVPLPSHTRQRSRP